MLKQVKEILNTMGKALTFANSGEMLTTKQKIQVLSSHQGICPIAHNTTTPRVILASNEAFTLESVELAIKLCRENNSMLDLLCVSPEGCETDINLSAVLTRLLFAEKELDFQITRRHGKLLDVIETYLHSRLDTLMTIINVNDKFKTRIKLYRPTDNWSRTSKLPVIELMDDLIQA